MLKSGQLRVNVFSSPFFLPVRSLLFTLMLTPHTSGILLQATITELDTRLKRHFAAQNSSKGPRAKSKDEYDDQIRYDFDLFHLGVEIIGHVCYFAADGG